MSWWNLRQPTRAAAPEFIVRAQRISEQNFHLFIYESDRSIAEGWNDFIQNLTLTTEIKDLKMIPYRSLTT
jgi:hypothetical protein